VTVLFPRLDWSIDPTRSVPKIRANCFASRCIVVVGIEL